MADNTDLWREALEVMGYEVMESAFGTPCVLRETKPLIPLHCEWELFGLAVEWIEARGLVVDVGHNTHYNHKCFMVRDPKDKFAYHGEASGRSFPEAAARWIVEHGAKIKEGEK